MACGVVLASLPGRRTPGWIYLVYAVAAMLAVDPGLIDDVAFQLSAAATAGVMLVAPVIRDWTLARFGWTEAAGRSALVEVAATATGATLAVVPVQAAAFGYVSLWSIPANIAVAPLYEGTVLIAAFAALVGWWTPAAEVIALGGRAVPEAFLLVVAAMARLPSASLPVSAPLPAGAAFFAVLILVTWWLHRRTGPPAVLHEGRRTGIEWTVMLAVVAGALWLVVLTPQDDLASITVLNVGQGSAALITDGETRVLVDTGPPDGAVIAALHRVGAFGSLDAVVLSHADTDHAGGLHPLVRRNEIRALYTSARALETLTFVEGEPITIGDRIHLSDRVSLEVLSPPTHTRDRRHESANDASLVLLVTVGERRLLLPGDIEAGAEDWLVRSGQRLDADVLVVPHQGSRTSSTQPFVDAVSASVAIASVGEENRFGHPHDEVVARYADTLFLRTDLDGDVTIRTDGERMWVSTSR
jgi:competence protein ComEC